MNIEYLNSPIKRHRTVVEWIKNLGLHFAASEKYTFLAQISTKLEWNDGQGFFEQNEPGNRQGFYLIANKIDFKLELIKRGSKSLFIQMRGIIQQEGIMTLNIDAPHLGAPNFIKQQISLNALVVGVLNTPLSSMGRSFIFF